MRRLKPGLQTWAIATLLNGPARNSLDIIQPVIADGRSWTAFVRLASLFQFLTITRQSLTGKRLHAWLQDAGVRCEPALEADNFDFIVNLVSLGLGASLVPHRVLALHPNTRPVIRVRTEPRFSRELAVVVRRQMHPPEILSGFLEKVLF